MTTATTMTAVPAAAHMGRILVVDDDARNRRLLDAMLAPEGYEINEAADGAEALAFLDAHPVDLVLLDVMMPGIDGVEVCERMHSDPRFAHIPVIFVTALSDSQSRVRGKEAGGDDFLTKPIDETELLVRVRNLLLMKLYHEHLVKQNDHLEEEVRKRTAALHELVSRLERADKEIRHSREETIQRLARVAEFRDDEAPNHTQRVAHYSELIARRAGLDETTCELLRLASPLHDVGNVAIPDAILRKPGKLTAEEFAQMQQHTEIGHRMLAGAGTAPLELAARIALSHHEHWDGTGYPRKLAGEAIPIEGRITAIADVFDSVTSKRVYKDATPLEDAVRIMRQQSGTQFDPRLVAIFLDALAEVLQIRERYPDA